MERRVLRRRMDLRLCLRDPPSVEGITALFLGVVERLVLFDDALDSLNDDALDSLNDDALDSLNDDALDSLNDDFALPPPRAQECSGNFGNMFNCASTSPTI